MLNLAGPGLRNIGRGDGSDFSMKISNKVHQPTFSCDLDSDDCSWSYSRTLDKMVVVFTAPPAVDGETKFMFFCSSPGVPKVSGPYSLRHQ